ncbi:MAG: hypothetical protein HYY93_01145 [Planctomycetes bacterium]|nr:hypothetical protein [Planctomycetota bacterium]
MLFLKRQLPLFLTFLFGMTVMVCYYVPNRASDEVSGEILKWLEVMLAVALILGATVLVVVHGEQILKQKAGWAYSLIVIGSILAGVALGLWENGKEYTEEAELTSFGWFYFYLYIPLNATMFALLAFFIASAAFRAFRARTLAAFCLLATAIIILFGQAPLGAWLWEKLYHATGDRIPTMADITGFMQQVLVVAGKRGILIGVSLGVIATSLRVIIGLERGYLGGDK